MVEGIERLEDLEEMLQHIQDVERGWIFLNPPAWQLDTKEKIMGRFRVVACEIDRLLEEGCPMLEDMLQGFQDELAFRDEERERSERDQQDYEVAMQEEVDAYYEAKEIEHDECNVESVCVKRRFEEDWGLHRIHEGRERSERDNRDHEVVMRQEVDASYEARDLKLVGQG